jgi:hypothetical protein
MRIRRMMWGVAFTAAVMLPAIRSADAQDIGQVGLVLGAGGTFRGNLPNGTFYNGLGYNILAGLSFSMPILPISVRVEGMYNQFSTLLSVYQTRVYSATANGVYTFRVIPIIHPYLVGGGGYYHLNGQAFNAQAQPGDPTEIQYVMNGAGINGGVGIRSGLGMFGFFAEWRYHYIFASPQNAPGGHTSFAPFTFGMTI